MATTPRSSEKPSQSQDQNFRLLEIKIPQPSLFDDFVPIVDNPHLESQNSRNLPSLAPEAFQSLSNCRTNSQIINISESHQHLNNLYSMSSSNNNLEITPGASSRSTTKRIFRTYRRLSLSKNPVLPRDRFIPPRSYPNNIVTKYQVRKKPLELTVNEKILRQRERSEDPFRRQRHRKPPIPPCTQNALQPPHQSPHIVDNEILMSQYPWSGQRIAPRQVSVGAVWNVGGASIATRGPWLGIVDGQEGYSGSNSTAPLYFASYEPIKKISISEEREMNEARLAAAFDMDLAHRQFVICKPSTATEIRLSPSSPYFDKSRPMVWEDYEWKRADYVPDTRARPNQNRRSFVVVPYCIVLSRLIKDDFYRSVLAYCNHSRCLAYATTEAIALWSTLTCKQVAEFKLDFPLQDQVTTLAFSSADGKQSILAAGTCCGYLHLWETLKPRKRFTWQFSDPITSVAFKPTTSRCLSTIFSSVEVSVEHLAVGDKQGIIWYYSVEISHFEAVSRVTLLARIDAHYGCICSITWSPNNRYLATGGDDNVCLLFDLNHILHDQEISNTATNASMTSRFRPILQVPQARLSSIVSQFARIFGNLSNVDRTVSPSKSRSSAESIPDTLSLSGDNASVRINHRNSEGNGVNPHINNRTINLSNGPGSRTTSRSLPPRRVASADYSSMLGYFQSARYVPRGCQIHQFEHNSAIKAIAFAPWQPTLLATGGGMGDRTVHFYHAPSGSCLAKIYMWAQVTGLIWSKTRREIAVILGFPEFTHPYRVVVFAWPSCEQITAIPWNINLDGQIFPDYYVAGRALSAVSVPNFRNPRYEVESSFDPEDECIAISANDFIRFYRIWGKPHKRFTGSVGVMSSAILESIDGIDNPGREVIR